MTQRTARIEDLPNLIARAKARDDTAQKRIADLTPQIAAAPEGDARAVLQLQLDNANLDSDNAKKLTQSLIADAQPQAAPKASPAELALAERQLEILQQDYSAYSASMAKMLADETQRQQQEMDRQKQEAAAPPIPSSSSKPR